MLLKKGGFFTMGGKTVGKLRPVICLDTLYRTGKRLYKMINEQGRGIGAMLLEGLNKTPAGVFINSSILKELFTNYLAVFQAGRRDKFNIYLNPLSGIVHLFVRLRDILWIGWMYSHNPLLSKETVKTGDRAGIAPLSQLHPENNKTGMRVSAAHIVNQLDFGRGMLVRMVMRASGAFPKGVP